MSWIKNTKLGSRLLVAGLGVPIIFVLTLLGRYYFTALILIISLVALNEFYALTKQKGYYPSSVLGLIAMICLSVDFYLTRGNSVIWIIAIMIFLVTCFELFKDKPNSISNMSITVFGCLYISLFSFLIPIREIPFQSKLTYSDGGSLIILIFITIWLCDTGAYFLGSMAGKHALYKRVSPNKTWEGAIGGLFTGILTSLVFRFLIIRNLPLLDTLVIGGIVGIIGQLSDLIESLIKRDAGVKDSSNILPGHGGFLDRFDSPILIAPIIYFYLILRGIL